MKRMDRRRMKKKKKMEGCEGGRREFPVAWINSQSAAHTHFQLTHCYITLHANLSVCVCLRGVYPAFNSQKTSREI